jgi:arginyl-tRNA synthetase
VDRSLDPCYQLRTVDEFKRAVAEVARKAGLSFEEVLDTVAVPRERERADLALPCFRWAKALKKAPPAIAAEVAAAFEPDEFLESAEATGPFVNFRIRRGAFTGQVLEAIDASYGRSDAGGGEKVVVDYGSPNIAKPLLFHHLRSAAIGQALCNLHRWRGYEVIGLNYLGDVGTAFGKLMTGIEEFGEATTAEQLNETYVKASKLCEKDPAFMDRARAWAKKLEDREPEAVHVWEQARALSLDGFRTVYDLLGIRHTVVDGEQMYVQPASALVEELIAAGRARESEGGIVIDLPRGKVLLIRKSDGATLYQTRDLTAARDRWERFHFARMLYVVDVAQEHYFQQMFGALKATGAEWADRCRHVKFGQVLFDGKRTKTREGASILLEEVLVEAIRRARRIIEEKNANLEDEDAVARAVGVAAVLFADVGFPTTKNIDFKWDEVISFDGRTGPYLQYVHASACSILRKGGERGAGDPALLTSDLEWDLVRRLAEFPAEVDRACRECEPSVIANFLYDLAREFRSYHTAGGRDRSLRVLVEDAALRDARLRLVDGVRQTLAIGLELLGIEPVTRM